MDVNTLIALSWDDHLHHQAAHDWFQEHLEEGFATCNATQSGFLRLSLNPKVVKCQITSAEAIAKLDSLTSQQAHKFWEDGPVETSSDVWATVTGHNQVPDTNLFLIARRHGGKVVTLDVALRNRLPRVHRSWIEVIGA